MAKQLTKEDAEKIKADVVVDARGQSCPGPMLEAKKALAAKVKAGQILELLSSDHGTRHDLETMCERSGGKWVYIGFFDAGGYDRHFVKKEK
ncbi:MAG: sulfurtransferase TusA family protein [Archaeoglobales archaeon]|nr:MAG: sulfurtransferase TusA family protein [Archaeoglobales archaeon]